MRQFVAYRNRNKAAAGLYPFLLNVQSDLIRDMETRVVIPLLRAPSKRPPAPDRLSPLFELDGEKFVLMTPMIASVGIGVLGGEAHDLSRERATILAALDLLISGI